MNTGSWLLLATVCWLAGFLNMWYLEPGPRSNLVYVPKWMFILFGMPRHKDVPITVQPVLSVYAQIMGLTMAIYGVLLHERLVKDPNLSGLLGFGLSMLLGIVISQWLYRRRPYLWKNGLAGDE